MGELKQTKDKESNEKEQSRSDREFMRRRHLARSLAMQFLFQADNRGEWEWSSDSFDLFTASAAIQDNDELDMAGDCRPLLSDLESALPYARKLAQGAMEHKPEIDSAIEAASVNWSLQRMSQADRAILRMASYELLFEKKVPAATSINEAVELSKDYGETKSPKFINGVLDKVREDCGRTGRKSI